MGPKWSLKVPVLITHKEQEVIDGRVLDYPSSVNAGHALMLSEGRAKVDNLFWLNAGKLMTIWPIVV